MPNGLRTKCAYVWMGLWEPVLCHPQMVRIPFAANWNLLGFCTNIKKTGCAGCSFHAPGVLCSPQVCGKLIKRSPLMHRMWTVQCVSGMLVYTKLNTALGTTNCKYLHLQCVHTWIRIDRKRKSGRVTPYSCSRINLLRLLRVTNKFYDTRRMCSHAHGPNVGTLRYFTCCNLFKNCAAIVR